MDRINERTDTSQHRTLISPAQWLKLARASALIGALLPMGAMAQDASASGDFQELYGGTDVVSLATGYERKLFDAPATTTIVTAEDIHRLGADSLTEVLQSVAGIHVGTQDGRGTVPEVRGITSRLLVLVNNLPIVNGLVNAYLSLDNVTLNDIERIEIVRGPGSAIYGGDACDGVVNLITKSSLSLPGTELRARVGDYSTYEGSFLHRANIRDTHVGVYIGGRSTEQNNSMIEVDAQTTLDRLFRTNASLAPGSMNNHRDILEGRLDVARGPWHFRVSHLNQYRFHTGVGLAYALDPEGTYDSAFSTAEAVYQARPWTNWEITAYGIGVRIDQEARNLHLYPRGAFAGLFPDGVRIDLDAAEQRVRGEVALRYFGFKDHMLRVGVGAFRNAFDTIHDRRNFIVRNRLILPSGVFAEAAGVNDVPFVKDTTTEVAYGYLQDEWTLSNDWRLTAGLRGDHYSDAGSELSPRLGLVWTPRHDMTVKWLYGHAFKPPSVTETQSAGVLIGLGDPNLKPETIDMIETAVQHRGTRTETTFSLFGYLQDDVIQSVASAASPNGLAFVNRGEQKGWGFEFEESVRLSPTLFFSASYAMQRRIGHDTDVDDLTRLSPRHAVELQMSWNFIPDWQLRINSYSLFDRERPASDLRPPPDNYTLLNLGIERSKLFGIADVSLSLKNALDADAREPSSSGLSIANDIPLPGRAIYGAVRIAF